AIVASGIRIDRVSAAQEVAQCRPFIWFLTLESQDAGRAAAKRSRQGSPLRPRAIPAGGDDEAGSRVYACQFAVLSGCQRTDIDVGIEDSRASFAKQRVTFALWEVGEVAAAAITQH